MLVKWIQWTPNLSSAVPLTSNPAIVTRIKHDFSNLALTQSRKEGEKKKKEDIWINEKHFRGQQPDSSQACELDNAERIDLLSYSLFVLDVEKSSLENDSRRSVQMLK